MRFLVLLPLAGFLIGTPFVNRVEPFVLGLPLVLAWLVFCVLATSVVMALIWRRDRARRAAGGGR